MTDGAVAFDLDIAIREAEFSTAAALQALNAARDGGAYAHMPIRALQRAYGHVDALRSMLAEDIAALGAQR